MKESLASSEQDYVTAIASNATWVCFCSNTKMYIVPNTKDLDPTELRTLFEIQNKEFITAMDFLDESTLVCGTITGHLFKYNVDNKERADLTSVSDEEQIMSIDTHSNAEAMLANTATTVYVFATGFTSILYKQLANSSLKNSSDLSQISCLFNQYILIPCNN